MIGFGDYEIGSYLRDPSTFQTEYISALQDSISGMDEVVEWVQVVVGSVNIRTQVIYPPEVAMSDDFDCDVGSTSSCGTLLFTLYTVPEVLFVDSDFFDGYIDNVEAFDISTSHLGVSDISGIPPPLPSPPPSPPPMPPPPPPPAFPSPPGAPPIESTPWASIGLIFGGGITAWLLCKAGDALRPGTNHLALFVSLLATFDFLSDILFIHFDLGLSSEVVDCYYVAVVFMVVSMLANAAVLSHFLYHQMTVNEDLHTWMAQNSSMAALVIFLAFTNVEAFSLVSCGILPFLNAQLSETQESRVQMLGLVTNMMEDLPQAIILIVANYRRQEWSNTAIISFVATALAICYGITKRLLSSLLFVVAHQRDAVGSRPDSGAADVWDMVGRMFSGENGPPANRAGSGQSDTAALPKTNYVPPAASVQDGHGGGTTCPSSPLSERWQKGPQAALGKQEYIEVAMPELMHGGQSSGIRASPDEAFTEFHNPLTTASHVEKSMGSVAVGSASFTEYSNPLSMMTAVDEIADGIDVQPPPEELASGSGSSPGLPTKEVGTIEYTVLSSEAEARPQTLHNPAHREDTSDANKSAASVMGCPPQQGGVEAADERVMIDPTPGRERPAALPLNPDGEETTSTHPATEVVEASPAEAPTGITGADDAGQTHAPARQPNMSGTAFAALLRPRVPPTITNDNTEQHLQALQRTEVQGHEGEDFPNHPPVLHGTSECGVAATTKPMSLQEKVAARKAAKAQADVHVNIEADGEETTSTHPATEVVEASPAEAPTGITGADDAGQTHAPARQPTMSGTAFAALLRPRVPPTITNDNTEQHLQALQRTEVQGHEGEDFPNHPPVLRGTSECGVAATTKPMSLQEKVAARKAAKAQADVHVNIEADDRFKQSNDDVIAHEGQAVPSIMPLADKVDETHDHVQPDTAENDEDMLSKEPNIPTKMTLKEKKHNDAAQRVLATLGSRGIGDTVNPPREHRSHSAESAQALGRTWRVYLPPSSWKDARNWCGGSGNFHGRNNTHPSHPRGYSAWWAELIAELVPVSPRQVRGEALNAAVQAHIAYKHRRAGKAVIGGSIVVEDAVVTTSTTGDAAAPTNAKNITMESRFSKANR
ncbi:hypothetical protein CYMTET_55655 [Cymbomonas tetramitiformis]|uniref:Uncharacterized protein n=1 Tax=Cymbomonas tetramitiformis TaxID=36881 RepID=A0AAE0BDX7_9CHLO|nr:hypothetical protein CYMTET_55655 [Cymbomonas tetramitiformis]